MRVTQLDIAKFAGVSQATVSRVLSGDDRVETSIRDRVLAVMKEHNYRPDDRARSLRQKRTHLIGLVLCREVGSLQGDPFFAQLVADIVDCLVGTPYHLCVDIAPDRSKQMHIYDELLRTRRVDGLILVDSSPGDQRITSLEKDNFPFVLIGNAEECPTLHAFDNDNRLAGRMAAGHLIEGGYERIAMIAGPADLTVTRDRVQGYLDAMERARMRPQVVYSEFGQEAARAAACDLFESDFNPDAILALDDFMAMGVVQSARTHRRQIPDQIGIVGFNDSPLCHIVEGGLTSVNLGIDRMVRASIRRLLDVIEGKEISGPVQQLVPCELIARGSSRRRGVPVPR